MATKTFRNLLLQPEWLACTLFFLASTITPVLAQPGKSEGPSRRFSKWPGTEFDRAYARLLRPEEIYGNRVPDHSRSLAFTAIYLEGTSWSEARALRHIRKTARILQPCGIQLTRIRLAKVRTPKTLRNIDVADKIPGADIPRDVYDIAAKLPSKTNWPAIFFVGRILGEEVLARSYQQGDVSAGALKDYPYMNTAWVSYRAHWVERPEDEYSALAHEIAHLLCRCGHEGGPQRHLLHEFRNFLGSQVLPQHCQKFRTSPLVTTPPH